MAAAASPEPPSPPSTPLSLTARLRERISSLPRAIASRPLRLAFFGLFVYVNAQSYKRQKEFLTVSDSTVLRWRLDKTSITEAPPEAGFSLGSLLSPGPGGPLASLTQRGVTLYDFIKTLKDAENDERVVGLVLDLASAGPMAVQERLGLAQVQEVKEALNSFRKTKIEQFKDTPEKWQKMVAVTDSFETPVPMLQDSQVAYYLASSFDSISLEPVGVLPLVGVSTVQPFVKNLLDRLQLYPRVFTKEQYKGVYSFLQGTGFSDPIRENTTSFVTSLNDQLVEGIARGRWRWLHNAEDSLNRIERGEFLGESGEPEDYADVVVTPPASASYDEATEKERRAAISTVERVLDLGGLSAREALSLGLVDILNYRRLMVERFSKEKATQGMFGEKKVKENKSMSIPRYKAARAFEKRTGVARYASTAGYPLPADATPSINLSVWKTGEKPKPPNKVTVGMVYITGMIRKGDGHDGSSNLVQALVDAGKDSDIEALVIRIDSGGGDAGASDTIWEAVKAVSSSSGKPIVASFGNTCASGGYYIAAACNRIFASPGTVTGSIGVAAMKPYVSGEFLDKIGVTIDSIFTSEGAKNGSIFHDIEGRTLDRMLKRMEESYVIFKKRVAEGRGWSLDKVGSIAGGRVYTGLQAYKLGLVDELGGTHDAVRYAATRAMEKRLDTLPEELKAIVEKVGKVGPPEEVDLKIFPAPKSVFARAGDFEDIDNTRWLRMASNFVSGVAMQVARTVWYSSGSHLEWERSLVDFPGRMETRFEDRTLTTGLRT
ncbi:hypothetical protein HDU93_000699 [Gonapodya sp. JEL0774]|nr:hypothetical protein HDU93_000699 [Gonapodya sp. JEL0774]